MVVERKMDKRRAEAISFDSFEVGFFHRRQGKEGKDLLFLKIF